MSNGSDPNIPAQGGPPGEIAMPMEAIHSGQTLQRVGTPFVTAISVQKPRDLDAIVKAMERECEYAGAGFYYSWTQGGKLIQDGSIGLAQSLAREWGNNAVTVSMVETDDTFIVTPRFIDLEKGTQTERVFRQRKEGAVHGKHDPDRKLDIALQIGQSKAIRNVIKQGVPRWLWDQCIRNAKSAVEKEITGIGVEKSRKNAIEYFATIGVTEAQLVAHVGRPVAHWVVRDIAELKGISEGLKSGDVSKDEIFPPETKPAQVVGGPVSPQGAMAATKVADPGGTAEAPPPAKPASPAGATPADPGKVEITDDDMRAAGGTPPGTDPENASPEPPPGKATEKGKGLFG